MRDARTKSMPAARPGLVDMMPDSFGILHGEGEGAIIAEQINDVSHAETYLKKWSSRR